MSSEQIPLPNSINLIYTFIMEENDLIQFILEIQRGEFEDSRLEVKRARKGLPKQIYEALSAFANQTDGGIIVLGIDESQNFAITGVENVQTVITELTNIAGNMEPPLSLDIQVVEVNQQSLIVVEVPECDFRYKPCYYKPSGMQTGAYQRVGNQNRRMTPYEIHSSIDGRGQPTFDRNIVKTVSIQDLDHNLLQNYLDHIKRTRTNIWNRLRLNEKDFTQQLQALDIITEEKGSFNPTLAGLLVFGSWPQKFYPSLMITFVRYYGTESESSGPRGERFMDNTQFEGSLSEIVEQAVNRLITNMKQSTLVEGVFHRMIPEYPEEAIREAIINAVAHRDYSPFVIGSQVRIEMFADRVEVISPGGLFGPMSIANLEIAQASRNQLLIRLLSEVGLVENRGSGIRAMIAAMREAHLEPPKFEDHRHSFKVIFSNQTLLDQESIQWLNQYADLAINSRQRTALVYLRKHNQMTNADYCRLNNVDSVTATRDLKNLVENNLAKMIGTRRWAYYELTQSPPACPNTVGVPAGVKVVLEGNSSLSHEVPDGNFRGEHSTLNPRQKFIMDYLEQHETITTPEFIKNYPIKTAPRTVRNDFKKLEELGIIQQKGSKKGSFYTK
jgi:ATP-dependent DNA helicase RecG